MNGWYRNSYLPQGLTTLQELQRAARLDNRQAAAFLGVSLVTFYRWKRNGNPPEWARLLLAMRAGHMPWEAWDRWRITPEGILPPAYFDSPLSPGEVMGMFFTRQELASYRAEARKWRALADQAKTPQEVPEQLKNWRKSDA